MATNLVSLIMQFLTPDMIGRIASALGLDRTNTRTAIGAAVPGLLAGLCGVAARRPGPDRTRRCGWQVCRAWPKREWIVARNAGADCHGHHRPATRHAFT